MLSIAGYLVSVVKVQYVHITSYIQRVQFKQRNVNQKCSNLTDKRDTLPYH